MKDNFANVSGADLEQSKWNARKTTILRTLCHTYFTVNIRFVYVYYLKLCDFVKARVQLFDRYALVIVAILKPEKKFDSFLHLLKC